MLLKPERYGWFMSHTLFNLLTQTAHGTLPTTPVISLHILVNEANQLFQIPEGPVTTKQ